MPDAATSSPPGGETSASASTPCGTMFFMIGPKSAAVSYPRILAYSLSFTFTSTSWLVLLTGCEGDKRLPDVIVGGMRKRTFRVSLRSSSSFEAGVASGPGCAGDTSLNRSLDTILPTSERITEAVHTHLMAPQIIWDTVAIAASEVPKCI